MGNEPKIFVPPWYRQQLRSIDCGSWQHVPLEHAYSGTVLASISDWLWLQRGSQNSSWTDSAFALREYLKFRLKCGSIATTNVKLADLCFPICGNSEDLKKTPWPKCVSDRRVVHRAGLNFEVDLLHRSSDIPRDRPKSSDSCALSRYPRPAAQPSAAAACSHFTTSRVGAGTRGGEIATPTSRTSPASAGHPGRRRLSPGRLTPEGGRCSALRGAIGV